ncbi:hypothetical protein V2G26_015772 [Clonostachys chloroleuca]
MDDSFDSLPTPDGGQAKTGQTPGRAGSELPIWDFLDSSLDGLRLVRSSLTNNYPNVYAVQPVPRCSWHATLCACSRVLFNMSSPGFAESLELKLNTVVFRRAK